MSKIENLLDEEGTAAENYELPEQQPAHVKMSRPNLGRATVISVRLSAEEHGRLQEAAEEANLPVSTLMRIWALDRLRAERKSADSTVTERLARLEHEVFQRTA